MKEYYLNTVSHKRLRQVVDSKNLLNKDDGLDQTMYNSSLGKTCVATNLKEIDGKLEAAPLVMISFGGFDGALDHDIIHELNHLYELSLESVINNKAVYLCGWDICEDDIVGEVNDYIDITKEEYLKIIETNVLPEKYQNIPYWLKNNIQYTTNLQNIEENYEKSFNKASSLIRKIIPRCTLDNFDINNEEIEKLDKVIEKYKETLKEYENFEK